VPKNILNLHFSPFIYIFIHFNTLVKGQFREKITKTAIKKSLKK
jgi:hypothetical protein